MVAATFEKANTYIFAEPWSVANCSPWDGM